MSEYTEEKRRRKEAVRQARRQERQLDTQLEKIERRLFRLLQFKEIITRKNVDSLIPMWNSFLKEVNDLEKALADLISIINV